IYLTDICNRMVTGTLICYTPGSGVSSVKRNHLRKELLGYKDYSNNGRYSYHRDGLLTKIPSISLIRSVFIIRNDDKKKVLDLLDKYNAKYYVREVILEKEDCHVLEIEEKK
ncbi:MAG: hypothetical protein QCH96_07545, partial [Candidatus Thermoplasmatota archaeon]|nr:hypothetical protein [Candidatus Thermoplasmatota archaeon]